MAQQNPSPAQRLLRSAVLFLAFGLLLYAGVYYAAERLTYRTGHANPLFKVAAMEPGPVDWVILGASHAMPFDFADFNEHMQRETGLTIVNLAAQGTGPLYNRFVFEQYLARHGTANLLYAVDSFAFDSTTWNEDRFVDSKLLARTPFEFDTAHHLAEYSLYEGVDGRAWLDYVTGFSKINNRDRFERDVWIGETQFERVFRPSSTADRQRIAYLYPAGTPDSATLGHYFAQFESIVMLARKHGVRVVAIKLPVPAQFRRLLPGEAAFDTQLAEVIARWNVPLHDLSASMDKPGLYLDTDHLNRTGATAFFDQHLKAILAAGRAE
jgi:hypothetical protein